MVNIAGVDIPFEINISGFLSSSWIYVLIVAVIGILLIIGVGILLFFKTYKKKVVVFENISGQGYQPILKTRARIIKLGLGGEELMKTLAGGKYVTAYGRKMGKNTFWFAKGSDGYWYNIVLGDLDTKMAMLDIEPIDRDVRMFHVGLQNYNRQTYDKKTFLEKYGIHMLLFVFLICLVGGMWIIIGQVGKATAPLAQANQNTEKTTELQLKITERLDNIVRNLGITEQTIDGGSGIVPAE